MICAISEAAPPKKVSVTGYCANSGRTPRGRGGMDRKPARAEAFKVGSGSEAAGEGASLAW